MDLQKYLTPMFIGGMIGFCAYILMNYYIIRHNKQYSCMSFALWSVLDIIIGYNMRILFPNSDITILKGFAIGSGITALILLFKGQMKWKKEETLTFACILVCLGIWWYYGAEATIIVGVISTIIAGIPLLRDTIKEPQEISSSVYFIFSLGSVISLCGATSWKLDQWLFSAASSAYCITIFLLSFRTGRKIVH